MKKKIIIITAMLSLLSGCAILQTLTNVSRLKFKLDSVNNFVVNNISITDKTKLSDFNTFDIIKLTSAVAAGKFPVSFNVNVASKNPNDGTGGYTATDLTIKSFAWDLYINDKKTISGNIDEPILVPGIGEEKIIKLKVEMDLLEFFGNKGLDEVLNLALKLGGKDASASQVQLIATPILGTPIGDLSYPEPITIVSHTFK